MSKPYDVLVVGELNVDLILNGIAAFPEVGKEILSEQMTLTMGSSSAIFASNLSTLGTKVSFVGDLGNDNFGDHMINSLQSRGVDTTFVRKLSKFNTGATIVLNFGEDRAMVTYPGAMKNLTVNDVSDSAIQSARHLHMSSVFLQSGMLSNLPELFSKAKKAGLTTSIDPQWDPSEKWDLGLKKLLPFVDVFMPNIAELKGLTGIDDMRLALESLQGHSNTIVVKHGNHGAYTWNNGNLVHQKPFLNTNVVDSIGAGDSFDAGYIHYFLQGKSPKECLEFGALTGAINTTRAGGTGAFQDLELVRSIAQSTFNYNL